VWVAPRDFDHAARHSEYGNDDCVHEGQVLRFGPEDFELDGTLSATAAINDPSNAGTTILLSEGEYRLGARWVLQPGMKVIGAARDLTIIDGEEVEWSGYNDDYSPLIGMGERTELKEVTVTGSRLFAAVGSEPGHLGAPPFSATVREVSILEHLQGHGWPCGLAFVADRPGQTSKVEIEQTRVSGSYSFGVFFGSGGADDAAIEAEIRDTEATGSMIGMASEFFIAEHGRIDILSSDNLFEGSMSGVFAIGGGDPAEQALRPGYVDGALYGDTNWLSHGDTLVGGMVPLVVDGSRDHYDSARSGPAKYNNIVVTLHEPVLATGWAGDLYPEYSAPAGEDRGKENTVEITIVDPVVEPAPEPPGVLTCVEWSVAGCNGVDHFNGEDAFGNKVKIDILTE